MFQELSQLGWQGSYSAPAFERRLGACRIVFAGAAPAQHIVRRALDYQPARIAESDQHRNAAAFEVKWYFVDFLPVTEFELAKREDGFVQQALQAGLEGAVQMGKQQYALAVMAIAIDASFETNPSLGQRPSLIGARPSNPDSGSRPGA